jgi:hypothetical protein
MAVAQTLGIAALGVRARAASPRAAPIRTPRPPPKNPSHPRPCFPSAVAAPEREREREEEEVEEKSPRRRTPTPPGASPHLRPYDDTDVAALPAQHRLAGRTSPLPRTLSSSARR